VGSSAAGSNLYEGRADVGGSRGHPEPATNLWWTAGQRSGSRRGPVPREWLGAGHAGVMGERHSGACPRSAACPNGA